MLLQLLFDAKKDAGDVAVLTSRLEELGQHKVQVVLREDDGAVAVGAGTIVVIVIPRRGG